MTHRFILEPYKGVASRHTCPECNHNRCFSRYIDTENVVSFPEYVGRCDREQKCGYHFTPKEYFEQKRITDQNEKLRSTKVCMGLTKKYGLYIASGKENVKEHRLKEPDKTKYEIFHALQSAIPKCRNWQQLQMELQKSGITIDLRKNGNTEQIQGVRFEKNGYGFNGSKVDRSCSYSQISFHLQQNERQQQTDLHQQPQVFEQNHSTGLSSIVESVASGLGGLFDIQPSSGYDEKEIEAMKEEAKKKKKKKRGRKI